MGTGDFRAQNNHVWLYAVVFSGAQMQQGDMTVQWLVSWHAGSAGMFLNPLQGMDVLSSWIPRSTQAKMGYRDFPGKSMQLA